MSSRNTVELWSGTYKWLAHGRTNKRHLFFVDGSGPSACGLVSVRTAHKRNTKKKATRCRHCEEQWVTWRKAAEPTEGVEVEEWSLFFRIISGAGVCGDDLILRFFDVTTAWDGRKLYDPNGKCYRYQGKGSLYRDLLEADQPDLFFRLTIRPKLKEYEVWHPGSKQWRAPVRRRQV